MAKKQKQRLPVEVNAASICGELREYLGKGVYATVHKTHRHMVWIEQEPIGPDLFTDEFYDKCRFFAIVPTLPNLDVVSISELSTGSTLGIHFTLGDKRVSLSDPDSIEKIVWHLREELKCRLKRKRRPAK